MTRDVLERRRARALIRILDHRVPCPTPCACAHLLENQNGVRWLTCCHSCLPVTEASKYDRQTMAFPPNSGAFGSPGVMRAPPPGAYGVPPMGQPGILPMPPMPPGGELPAGTWRVSSLLYSVSSPQFYFL